MKPGLVVLGRTLGFVAALLGGCGVEGQAPGSGGLPPPAEIPRFEGTLRISALDGTGPAAPAGPAACHRTTVVPGARYGGMEDNDIRGFLDGVFKWGWNQVGQSHVRIGRRGRGAAWGEYEVFRTLQRWVGLPLPADAQLCDARLVLTVESGPDFPVDVALYAVQADWNPGRGGRNGDSISVPRTGEVWWGERGYRSEPWGLPGAGLAADDPGADTTGLPLAQVRLGPGERRLELRSAALVRYLQQRVAAGRPLLFLVKLGDYHEDRPGSMTELYSANYGDHGSVADRPRLEIAWKAPAERVVLTRALSLEYGRSFEQAVPDLPPGVPFVAEFLPAEGAAAPHLQVCCTADDPTWQPAGFHPGTTGGLRVRLDGARMPVALGQAIELEIGDAWMVTGPPEEQVVTWTFVSPAGIVHRVVADHDPPYRWRVRFVPDEVGPWSYFWTHRFYGPEERRGPTVWFDVLARDLQSAHEALERLAGELEARPPGEDAARRERMMYRFATLERALMQQFDAEGWRGPQGTRERALLRRIRGLLQSTPPDPLPMQDNPPFEWQQRAAEKGS